jgi:hypothetical protein
MSLLPLKVRPSPKPRRCFASGANVGAPRGTRALSRRVLSLTETEKRFRPVRQALPSKSRANQIGAHKTLFLLIIFRYSNRKTAAERSAAVNSTYCL